MTAKRAEGPAIQRTLADAAPGRSRSTDAYGLIKIN